MIEDVGLSRCSTCDNIAKCKYACAFDHFGFPIKNKIYGKHWCDECWNTIDEIRRYRLLNPYNGRVRDEDEGTSHPCIVCGTWIDDCLLYCPGDKKCFRAAKKRDICLEEASTYGYNSSSRVTRNGIHHYEKKHCIRGKMLYRCICGAELRKEISPYLEQSTAKLHTHQRLSTTPQYDEYHFDVRVRRVSFSSSRTALGKLRHLCFKRDNYKCRDCGATKDDCILEIDHIIPYSLGGQTDLDNLQTLCKRCNRAKHTRIWRGGE